ncbi:MAG: hypothetical protein U5J63_14690, partial [Fodinibius sp.]|nr:hypothetical protein [Fodinibius sp.]
RTAHCHDKQGKVAKSSSPETFGLVAGLIVTYLVSHKQRAVDGRACSLPAAFLRCTFWPSATGLSI